MNLKLKIYSSFEYANMRLFFFIFILGTFFLLYASLWTYDISYSQENQTNSMLEGFQSLNIPQSINESYSNPRVGFHILLPSGWKGLSYQNIAMVSPAGMNIRTGNLGSLGSGADKVLMVIEALNVSDFLDQRKNYGEIEKKDCRIVSDKYIKINGVNGQELFWQCGSDNKIINDIFGAGNEVIIVGLKGAGSVFDNNLDKFRNSVDTLRIDKPTDIKKIT